MLPSEVVLPDYSGRCVTNLVPNLVLRPPSSPSWLPRAAVDADQVVLLVIDGLGARQLAERTDVAPTLADLDCGTLTTVAPSTTAAALTSITTGVPPGEHGVVGYRILVEGEVLNVLRWTTPSGDARDRHPADAMQPLPPFVGSQPPVVTKSLFGGSGFTAAHLRESVWRPWSAPSGLPVVVGDVVGAGAPFVYAYHDVLDQVAHVHGLDEHYDAELRAVDRLVADVLDALPAGVALVVTADHGHVHVGDHMVPLSPGARAACRAVSGEARFRWLHARPGRADEVLELARADHADHAEVVAADEAVEAGWFGPLVTGDARTRLGDVAVVSTGLTAFDEPGDRPSVRLIGRHGGLAADEMLVPLLVGVA